MSYTLKLIDNLAIHFKGSGIICTYYDHINTIRLTIPADSNLKEFADDFYYRLERLPEIPYDKQMVKFWLCQQGTADFHIRMINPSEVDNLHVGAIGISAGSWVSFEHYKYCVENGKKYSERIRFE